ncbi:MAG TPA: metal-sensitive transcriptional regulator [Vitreimonas sp.]|nr:metal-sensitive transcriptional regulator [Vitreimonas sp.]
MSNSISKPSEVVESSTSNPDQVLTQLKRIRGQLDGVITMYEDERACVDIVRQVIAARNSLGRVARDLLTGEATRCSRERRVEDLDEILKELFKY